MSFSNEDKEWLSARFGQLDTGFEQLDTRFEQIDTRFGQLEARFEARFERIETRLTNLEEKVDQLDQKIERVETALLTEFHKWASPVEMRLRSHTTVLRTIDMDMEALTDRVKRLEGPAAA
jgi:predicted nuclease with TOPRIM domain